MSGSIQTPVKPLTPTITSQAGGVALAGNAITVPLAGYYQVSVTMSVGQTLADGKKAYVRWMSGSALLAYSPLIPGHWYVTASAMFQATTVGQQIVCDAYFDGLVAASFSGDWHLKYLGS
jgi:hypothetical protein